VFELSNIFFCKIHPDVAYHIETDIRVRAAVST